MSDESRPIQPGDPAPDIPRPTWPEGELKLSDLRGRWVVLYFYPKDNTPGCTNEAKDFRDLLPAFEAEDGVVLGVSRDSVASHKRFAERQALNFTLIADEDEALCRAFDVIRPKKLYGRAFMGVERSTFLIDPEGIVRHEWRKVRVKGHAGQVLETLKELRTGAC
ncbi:MAG: peroxiredoxin [Mariprofundaceae bacterium]